MKEKLFYGCLKSTTIPFIEWEFEMEHFIDA